MENKKYYTKTDLKRFGFSETLINKIFPNPITKANPFYRCANPMKLYDSKLVDEYMKTDDFQIHLQKRNIKAEKSKIIAINRKESLIEEINKKIKEIKVERIDIKDLEKRTLISKYNWLAYCKNNDFDFLDPKEETLKRWMINYIRHELTSYDEVLYNIKGKIGKQDAYQLYRTAVMDKIKEIYPELFE